MNVKLLRKVKRHILAVPKRLDMNTLGERRIGRNAPACKTAACIAGWACVITHGEQSMGFNDYGEMTVEGTSDLWNMAKALLGLDGEVGANTLFREPRLARNNPDGKRLGWPEKFSTKYEAAKTAVKRAQITAARIEHFIKTKGRE